MKPGLRELHGLGTPSGRIERLSWHIIDSMCPMCCCPIGNRLLVLLAESGGTYGRRWERQQASEELQAPGDGLISILEQPIKDPRLRLAWD